MLDVLLGVAVGDAIGVPVEFQSRTTLRNDPVTGVRAYGSDRQPAGTWSDDSSMTFCLAEMLCEKLDPQDLANRFVNWKNYGYWSPHGEVFDMGIATSAAISRLEQGVEPTMAGGTDEGSNGNGSLMRILPLVFLLRSTESAARRMRLVSGVSSLTHGHPRSVIACYLYLELALAILEGKGKHEAYNAACEQGARFFGNPDQPIYPKEREVFHRFLSGEIAQSGEDHIYSSGYVVHTLEAAVWSLLNSGDYAGAVLKAVNLGEDTDTTGAVVGGLAGLLYGWQSIPADWLAVLARRGDIEDLAKRMNNKFKV